MQNHTLKVKNSSCQGLDTQCSDLTIERCRLSLSLTREGFHCDMTRKGLNHSPMIKKTYCVFWNRTSGASNWGTCVTI